MRSVRGDATTHRHLRGNLTSRSAKIKYVDVGDSANHDTLYDGIGAKDTTDMRYFVGTKAADARGGEDREGGDAPQSSAPQANAGATGTRDR